MILIRRSEIRRANHKAQRFHPSRRVEPVQALRGPGSPFGGPKTGLPSAGTCARPEAAIFKKKGSSAYGISASSYKKMSNLQSQR